MKIILELCVEERDSWIKTFVFISVIIARVDIWNNSDTSIIFWKISCYLSLCVLQLANTVQNKARINGLWVVRQYLTFMFSGQNMRRIKKNLLLKSLQFRLIVWFASFLCSLILKLEYTIIIMLLLFSANLKVMKPKEN